MKQYELTFLIPPSYTKSEQDKIEEEIEQLIDKHNGRVDQKDTWGKRELAYTLNQEGKTYDEAFYFHWLVSFKAQDINSFKQGLNLNDTVIRYLVVAHEE